MTQSDPVHTDVPLAEDAMFLQRLVTNISEGLLTIDTEGEILYANPALEEILGYGQHDLIGSPLTKIVPRRLESAHEAGLARYLETGEKNLDWGGVELPAVHNDGHEVPTSISFQEHEYDGRRLFTAIITDITEQKAREERLQAQNEQLEGFAHVLTHDLRNPVAIAQGYIEVLKEEHEIEELDEVDRAISRIHAITEDTLNATFNGEHDGSPTVRSLRDLVQMAWDSVLTGEAELVLPDPAWNIRATEGCFLKLLENLIRNSVEHGGSSVTVEVGILGDAEGFYVEDDGSGISAERKDELRISGESGASEGGYGLTMVERVAEEHGWEMAITDSATGGARFEFTGVAIS